MKRTVLLLAVTLAVAVGAALPAIAADDGKVKRFAQAETLGFYRGSTVAYLDFGPVKLARGNKVAPIWAFTNGANGQRNIIDTVPGPQPTTRRSGPYGSLPGTTANRRAVPGGIRIGLHCPVL